MSSESKSHIHFDRSNVDIFLRDLERDLSSMTYNNNIDQIYYHFTTTLSTTINKFSNKTSYKKNIRTSNPCTTKTVRLPGKKLDMPLMKALSSIISVFTKLSLRGRRGHILIRDKIIFSTFIQFPQ